MDVSFEGERGGGDAKPRKFALNGSPSSFAHVFVLLSYLLSVRYKYLVRRDMTHSDRGDLLSARRMGYL